MGNQFSESCIKGAKEIGKHFAKEFLKEIGKDAGKEIAKVTFEVGKNFFEKISFDSLKAQNEQQERLSKWEKSTYNEDTFKAFGVKH